MKIGHILSYILVGAIALMGLGATMVFTERTLAPWWPFWVGALALGLILGLVLAPAARYFTGWTSRPANHIAATVYLTIVGAGALYTLNYAFADKTTEHTEQVLVERKYTKTRHRSERSGRHYRQGAAYKVYFIDVRFDDGRTTTLEIPLKRYNRLRTGAPTDLTLATGLLSAPVIKF